MISTYGTFLIGFKLVRNGQWSWIMEPGPSPLEEMFQEINAALEAKLYYLAIAVSLTIPDICAALECDPAKIWVRPEQYVEWCDKNLIGPFKYIYVRGLDVYRLRGGVVHQGSFFGHPKMFFDHILFTLPNVHRAVMHMHFMQVGDEKALVLDATTFCGDMMNAARQWYEQRKTEQNVRVNVRNLVRLRPDGMPPFIVGAPLIA